MNNSSLLSANSATHIKIVAVALVAGILVVGVGLAARHDLGTDVMVSGTPRLEAQGPIIRAGEPRVIAGEHRMIR
ncbi:MAG: hypothetical protein KJZ73_18105 [Pseudorhodoplanes sp.]|nr:hypothetical protein [Pseudorhodoplanes sp.]MCL4713158.1 hypothetical protein [Pseudorhodoplanes sp.]MCQ3943489.1 hypothetical protein [Alphaproteobacteria bacterium]GIK80224.1 MAG: hypothetical protein BroJett024_13290 [Alphaproteobacteria bacterium]